MAASDEDVYFSELPIVASVSRLPQRLADAPTAVTVIDRDTIKASGARDLNDVFRLVPGFQTYPNNTEAARVSYHGLNDGDYASRLQVLVDGRSLYSPLFGNGVNWATLPVAIEDIERIEVVRGTNAVSYGNNAFLGVINIITVDPSTVRGLSVSTSYGNQNVRDYSLRTGGKLGESGHFRFTYRQQNDDGLTNRDNWVDSYFTRLFDFRADFQLNDRDTLQVSAGSSDGVVQTGRKGDVTGPLRPLRQSDSYFQTVMRRVLSADSEISARYSYVIDQSDDTFYYGPFRVNFSGDEGIRHELEIQQLFRLGPQMRLAWGASWRNDSMRSASLLYGQGEVHRDIGRVFGNLEWRPADWLTANLGLAEERDSLAGNHLAPRGSLNFHLNPENTLRFGMSQAYHTGSIVSYRAYMPTPLGVYAQATPGLPPERLDTVEIGYLGDWRAWRSSLDVRVFRERVHDEFFRIDVGSAPQTTIPLQNVDISGVEYQLKWQPLEGTRLTLSQAFTRISSHILDSATQLINSIPKPETNPIVKLGSYTENSAPRRSTSLLLMQKLPYGLEFSTAAYWQSLMQWSTNTNSRKYNRVDARLGYPFKVGNLGGEVALTVQSLNGDHNEYKSGIDKPQSDDHVVSRREWLSLRLDF